MVAGRLYPASVLLVSGEGKLKVHARLRLPQPLTSGSNFNQAADPCASYLNCAGDKQGFAKKGVTKNVQAYVPLPHATGCGICTRLCIIHFFLCGPSALDRAALIGEEICERITEQETLAKKRVVRMSARGT